MCVCLSHTTKLYPSSIFIWPTQRYTPALWCSCSCRVAAPWEPVPPWSTTLTVPLQLPKTLHRGSTEPGWCPERWEVVERRKCEINVDPFSCHALKNKIKSCFTLREGDFKLTYILVVSNGHRTPIGDRALMGTCVSLQPTIKPFPSWAIVTPMAKRSPTQHAAESKAFRIDAVRRPICWK